MPIKRKCFAYDKNKNRCHALIELDCTNCHFYTNKKNVVDNPFYEFSYTDAKEMAKICNKRFIKKDLILKNDE